MKLPAIIRKALFRLLYNRVAMRRPPDQVIGGGNGWEDPYMYRWWLFGTSKTRDRFGDVQPRRPFGLTIKFHLFQRSDHSAVVEDHLQRLAGLDPGLVRPDRGDGGASGFRHSRHAGAVPGGPGHDGDSGVADDRHACR